LTGTAHVLTASSLFHGLSASQCEPFEALVREQRLAEHDMLFRIGETADALFIVRSGVIHLTMPLAMHGRDCDVVVQEARAGETVAWSALIEPYRFTMNARAGTDVELLAFSPRAFRIAVAANPDAGVLIMNNLAKVIAQRLQVMHAMWTRELQRTVNETFR
jgi:CRP/FNR family transcriptional regulator, cyclic AMP receptor protein